MRHNVSTKIILDTRYKHKDGKFPVKLRLIYNRVPKYYGKEFGINVKLSKDQFKQVNGNSPRGENKKLKLHFASEEQRARDIINEMSYFTFYNFEKKFKLNKGDTENIFFFFEQKIKALEEEDKHKSAEGYEYSLRSFKKFVKKDKLRFFEVSPDWLKKYERWMRGNGASDSTISRYLRELRTIFKGCIKEKVIPSEVYPFDDYQIPRWEVKKRSLEEFEIKRIFEHEPEKMSNEHWARDFWIFSYLFNGANPTDIFRLKFKDIYNNEIRFIRKKTTTKTKDKKQIIAPLLPEFLEIIKRWGNSNKPDNFIFPVLENRMNEKEIIVRIKSEIRKINTHLKKLGEKLSITRKLTTMTARDSHGTQLIRQGVPVKIVTDNLGHTSSLITERHYIDEIKGGEKEKHYKNLKPWEDEKPGGSSDS